MSRDDKVDVLILKSIKIGRGLRKILPPLAGRRGGGAAMVVANFGHVVFAQIRQLLSNLNKKNFKATCGELSQVLCFMR